MITTQQIKAIARESKSLSKNGLGTQLAIFADGTTSPQPSRQSLTCFIAADGERTYPLVWINLPQTVASLTEIIRRAEEYDRQHSR